MVISDGSSDVCSADLTIAIALACVAIDIELEPAVGAALHRLRWATVNLQIQFLLTRCPDAEVRALSIAHSRTERQQVGVAMAHAARDGDRVRAVIRGGAVNHDGRASRSEEHTAELQSLMRI